MNPQSPSSIGEAAIPDQVAQQVAPDVSGQQGQQQLFQKAVEAHTAKNQLDAILKAVSEKIGAETTSRVKDIETASKKIVQKRLQGRDYGINDINDMLGERIIVSSDRDIPKAKEALNHLAKAGIFTIDKQEPVKQHTYSAYHIDGSLSNGTRFEIQIMNKKQEAESLINHGLRAVHGENPEDKAVGKLRDKQASMINSLSNDKAQAVSQAMKNINQQNNNQPIDPRMTAGILAQVNQ